MSENRRAKVLRPKKVLALTVALAAGLLAPAALPAAHVDTANAQVKAVQQVPSLIPLSEGAAQWGFRKSFLDYLALPFVSGTITASDGISFAGNNFSFVNGSGTYSIDNHVVSINYPGSINFTGHGGVLDTTLKNWVVEIDPEANVGRIFVDADWNAEDGSVYSKQRALFATISNLSSLDTGQSSGVMSLADAPVLLADDGAEIMGGAYDADRQFAPISLQINVPPQPDPEPEPTEDPTPEPTEVPTLEPTEPVEEPTAEPTQEPEPTLEPTPTPTPTETNSPTQTVSPSPTPTPTETSTKKGIEKASFNWGVKESYMSYIVGPIANGEINVSNGSFSGGQLKFNDASGSFDTKTKAGEIAWDGSANFYGHGGQLNTSFTNFSLKFSGKNSATLVADVESKTTTGGTFEKDNVSVGTVSLKNLKVASSSLSLKNAAVTLTATGSEAFGGFYKAGEVMAPLDVTASYSAEADTEVKGSAAPPASGGSQSSGKGNGGPSNTGGTATTGASTTTSGNNTAGTTQSAAGAQSQEMVEVCTANGLEAGTASWGVKASFTSYLRSAIANGDWSLSGVSYSDGQFHYGGGTGTFDQQSKTGNLSLPGTIHFTGHSGALDMKLSNMNIQITGPSSARLILDVASKGMDSDEIKTSSGVVFANISGPINVSGNTVSASGAAVTLTQIGAEAFADFYSAGEQMDPISFSATIGEGTDCTMVPAGSAAAAGAGLAKTGSASSSLVAGGLTALVLGGTALYLAGRRKVSLGGQR